MNTATTDEEISHAKVSPVSASASEAKISAGVGSSNISEENQVVSISAAAASDSLGPETDTVEEKAQRRQQQQETMIATNPSPVALLSDKNPGPSPPRVLRAEKSSLQNKEVRCGDNFPAISLTTQQQMPMRSGSDSAEPELQPEVPSSSSKTDAPAVAVADESSSSVQAAQLPLGPQAASLPAPESTRAPTDSAENKGEEGILGQQQQTGCTSASRTEQRQDPDATAADQGSRDTIAAAQAAAVKIEQPISSLAAASRPSNANTKRKSPKAKPSDNQSSGRWTREEHDQFLEGLKIYGREWKKVAQRIPTRTSAQIRSHAQKYFSKLAREEQQQQAAAAAVHGQHQILGAAAGVLGVSGDPSAANLLVQPAAALSSSARTKANRILADPTAVEREVEETLAALRERYRQLQNRLGSSQHERRRGSGSGGVGGGAGAGASNSNRPQSWPPEVRPANAAVERQSLTQAEERARMLQAAAEAPMMRRKRTADEMRPSTATSSTTEEADVAPTTTDAKLLQHREFGNEELIALSVLGGSLPQSGSRENLVTAAAAAASSSGVISPEPVPAPAPAPANNAAPRTAGSARSTPNSPSTEITENNMDEGRTSDGGNKRHRASQ